MEIRWRLSGFFCRTSMLFLWTLGAVAAFVRAAPQQQPLSLKTKLVESGSLQSSISLDALLAHATKLQGFAYSYPERNRLFGGSAHNDTIQYVYDTLSSLDGYYNVTLQPFSQYAYVEGSYALLDESGVSIDDAALFTYSPNGNVPGSLTKVNNDGCDPVDFPASVEGKIALIPRGTCAFGLKVVYAAHAGAAAVIIYNNGQGTIAGTLEPPRDEGPYVPALSVSQTLGQKWAQQLEQGSDVKVTVIVEGSSTEVRYTNNVIAQTVQGNQDDILHIGAHSDSVSAGPGINDNGSGSIAILEVAFQLSRFRVNNAIRFSWWSAEEQGLQGSTYWVTHAPDSELDKIRLYLNFDMVASPNYVLGAYDGDGAVFGITGPPGSAEAKHLFQDYFASVGQNSTSSEFNGRSDYGPFLDAGIASGGLDTGAEGVKTPEEEQAFGGKAGEWYDKNYHQSGDTLDNLAHEAFEVNAKAIAHAAAIYAQSFDSLPQKQPRQPAFSTMSQKFLWKGGVLVA